MKNLLIILSILLLTACSYEEQWFPKTHGLAQDGADSISLIYNLDYITIIRFENNGNEFVPLDQKINMEIIDIKSNNLQKVLSIEYIDESMCKSHQDNYIFLYDDYIIYNDIIYK